MANTAKIRQGFVENSKVISKRGSLKSGDFDETGDDGENGKFGGNSPNVSKFKRDIQGGLLKSADKMANMAKMTNLAKIQRRSPKGPLV